jgi:putative two-component system response regulator
VRASDAPTGARILIVDDQESNVRLLEGILRRAGYTQITSTMDPRLALGLYEDLQPDLLLLDLMMPEMDGYQVMEVLAHRIPEGTYVPILVLTADPSREAWKRALSIGAKDFLMKPFDQEEVLLRIRNLLETRSLHLELQAHNALLEEKVQERTNELRRSLELLERTVEEQGKLLAKLNVRT